MWLLTNWFTLYYQLFSLFRACLPIFCWFQVLEELPVYKTLLEQFTNNELIDKATLDKQYEKELREGTGVFDANTEMGRKHWQDLRDAMIKLK